MSRRLIQGGAVVLCLAFLTACATPQGRSGAITGGIVGAVVGALKDRANPWRGLVKGAVLGAVMGKVLGELAAHATQEAISTGHPVAYQSADGWQRVEVSPLAYNARTRCHKVRERRWLNGQLVMNTVREVCRGQRTTPTY